MTDTVPALDLRGLRKEFRRLKAVNGVDLRIANGELVGLIGRNGAGKSTLIRMVMGELRPDAGEVLIAGSSEAAARRGVGYVPQGASLYPDLTGRENLAFIASVREIAPDRQQAAIDAALDLAQLGEAADRLTREYSGGMRMRLSLASTMLGDPGLIILDESFEGLDPEATLRFRDQLVRHVEQGGAALLCSHNLDLLARIATRIVLMEGGCVSKILAGGDVEALEACFSVSPESQVP